MKYTELRKLIREEIENLQVFRNIQHEFNFDKKVMDLEEITAFVNYEDLSNQAQEFINSLKEISVGDDGQLYENPSLSSPSDVVFLIKYKETQTFLVNTEGFDYPRYVTEIRY